MVPHNTDVEFRIPSDLTGLNYAQYILPTPSSNIDASIGPACTEIKRRILEKIEQPLPNLIIEKFGYFTEFDSHYTIQFEHAKEITTSFIHSRRWRETNLLNINRFFKWDDVCWNVILPNLSDELLVKHLKLHFQDGDTLKSKILDAYIFFASYQKKYPRKVKIYLYNLYPTYSFYKFDDTLVVSLYPLTDNRRPTPTFQFNMRTNYAEFFQQDIDIIKEYKPISLKDFDKIINEFKEKFA